MTGIPQVTQLESGSTETTPSFSHSFVAPFSAPAKRIDKSPWLVGSKLLCKAMVLAEACQLGWRAASPSQDDSKHCQLN